MVSVEGAIQETKLFLAYPSLPTESSHRGRLSGFRRSVFAEFELSWGWEIGEKRKVFVHLPSVSSGHTQVPGDDAVAPFFSQVHGQTAPGIAHV